MQFSNLNRSLVKYNLEKIIMTDVKKIKTIKDNDVTYVDVDCGSGQVTACFTTC